MSMPTSRKEIWNREMVNPRTATVFLLLCATPAAADEVGQRGSRTRTAGSRGAEVVLVLPESLAPRRQELSDAVAAALDRVRAFATTYDWEQLTDESFMDRVMIFDKKGDFDRALLSLSLEYVPPGGGGRTEGRPPSPAVTPNGLALDFQPGTSQDCDLHY